MSRSRQRHRSSSSSSSSQRRKNTWLSTWLLRIFIVCLFMVAVCSIVGYLWLKNYLASDIFRKTIVAEASQALDAEVNVGQLRWDGFRVNSDLIEATGTKQCRSIKWDGIRTGIEIGSIAQGVWKVSPSRIGKVSVVWDATSPVIADARSQSSFRSKQQSWYKAWVPSKYATNTIIVENSDIRVIVKEGNIRLSNMRWELDPSENLPQTTLNVSGGKIHLPYALSPQIELNKASISYRHGNVYLSDFDASAYERGHISMNGEWDQETKTLQLEGEADEIQCHEVLPSDWKQKLMGTIQASAQITRSGQQLRASGHLAIKNGIITALPVLDQLAAYSQSLRFRSLTLNAAECDFRYENEILTLSNIQLGSESLARLEGSCRLSPLENGETALDGWFRLGLAPGTLASIPGAEEEVFLPGERGLLWAPMRITGTLQNPKEDLGDRLMAAAGARMFDVLPETGVKLLKYTQNVIEDRAKPVIDKGSDLARDRIEKATDAGSKILEAISDGTETRLDDSVHGLLDGFLGRKQRPDSKENQKSHSK